jgi:8-oxo-dGTP pyrophosphatase MutT (NUDIX family)
VDTLIEDLAQRLRAREPFNLELPAQAQAAVAVILTPAATPSTAQVLLILRSLRAGDPWSGHMALPGGRRDPEDGDLRDTAVREVREEIGVELGGARLLGRLDELRPIRQSARLLAVRPFVFWLPAQPELQAGAEVAATLWVPLAQLRHSAGEADVEHAAQQLRVQAFLVEGRVIWGMTQRVLAGLLELLPAPPVIS